MNNNKLKNLQFIASLLVFAGVFMKFTNVEWAEYVYSFGVLGLIVQQILFAVETKHESIRFKRLASLMFIATVALGMGAYFMFIDNDNWVVMVLLYALISLFLSFRGKK